jgi:hypothetical protein
MNAESVSSSASHPLKRKNIRCDMIDSTEAVQ